MNNFKRYILTGIISIIPLMITVWIIQKLFIFFSVPGTLLIELFINPSTLDNYYYLNKFYDYINNITGFLLTLIFLYVLGLIIKNVVGKRIYSYFESLLENIPVINKIYSTTKNITTTLTDSKSNSFNKVVIIEYPRKGLWTLAMVTGETMDTKKNEYYTLFVPTTPNPTSGYMIIVNKNDAKDTSISVDEGLSIIVSGGMISPEEISI